MNKMMKGFTYRFIKYVSIVFLCLASIQAPFSQVITEPLQFNGEKYREAINRGAINANETQSQQRLILGSQDVFYLPDTLNLPFVDDFSQNKFPRFEPWFFPDIRDTLRPLFTITPQPSIWPFPYQTNETFSYFIVDNEVDSVLNATYQVVYYNDTLNPYRPTDTLVLFEHSPFRLRKNPLTTLIDTILLFPEGSMNDDSLAPVRIFMPNGDGSLWIDNDVYINRTMALEPPTIGVVTFDGTNALGMPYSQQIASNGWADKLTSKPIDLQYLPSDSIYLSFYYQPQGRGYAPAPSDSLALDFLDYELQKWIRVWATPGDTLQPFKQALIPITEQRFLKKGFRFRFTNFANLSGNVDHWNLDYVKLDRFRNNSDTLQKDVAFVSVRTSILRGYQAAPWSQFTQSLIENKWRSNISNRDTTNKSIAYRFQLEDKNGTVLNQYPAQYTPLPSDTNLVLPFYSNGYADYARFMFPDFNYNFETEGLAPFTDSATFKIVHLIENFDYDDNTDNDTAVVVQNFHNYWAYDDGTAEKALFLGNPGNFALKFQNTNPDTLFGIAFYFNPVREINQFRNIFLRVWSSIAPDQLLYEQQVRIQPLPSDTLGLRIEKNNGFTYFILKEPVPLNSGPFYVGWRQSQTFKANIGFDLNNDASSMAFFKTSGQWIQMEEQGAPMIRPLLANTFSLEDLGTNEIEEKQPIVLYPNPAQNYFKLEAAPHVSLLKLQLTDITGRLIRTYTPHERYEISDITPGMYVITIHTTEEIQTLKLWVSPK